MSVAKDNVIPSVVLEKQNKELLTPHRLTVGILIMEFYKIRSNAFCANRRCFIRDFSLLILKLMQTPDISYRELNDLIAGMESASEEFVENLNATIENLCSGIGGLQDVVDAIGQLMLMDNQLGAVKVGVITRNSIVGCFLRRLVINFDKLTFSEICVFHTAYKKYCEPSTTPQERDVSVSMEEKNAVVNRDWTQRQAELFIATQSTLITNDECKALPPQELHQYIRSLLKSNPDLSAAHFLNYLNYLRVKEYCGAMDSLYLCFDKSAAQEKEKRENSIDERSKCYRYAALNLAILHCQFGHKDQGLMALKDCIKMAQDAGDNLCLQHALSWLRCLTNNHAKLMAEHSVIKSLELNLSYVMSLGIQSFVKYCGLSTANPLLVFDSLTRSDVINAQNGHTDLIATNYGLKAGLWLYYGKTEMCNLWSQLLLYLNADAQLASRTYYGESYVHALCNVAGVLQMEGEYASANVILAHAEARFPRAPLAHAHVLARNLFDFERFLLAEQTAAAASVAAKLGVVDRQESRLCAARLHLHVGDYGEAHRLVNSVLDECKAGSSEQQLRMDVQVRTMLLLAQIQIASHYPSGGAIPGIMGLLHSSLAYAKEYNMMYLAAMAQMYVAHVLLLMKMSAQAVRVMQRCIVPILADGGRYDRARALLLYVQCNVACASATKEDGKHREVIQEALKELETIQLDFEKVEAVFRVKDILLLQAALCDEIGMEKQRNRFALDYRTLNAEQPSVYGSQLFKII